jgi:hypothetical protein
MRAQNLRLLVPAAALFLLAFARAAGAAPAVVPDPYFSTCPNMVTVGDGSCCYTVVVMSQFDIPIRNSNVMVDFSPCPGLTLGVQTDGSTTSYGVVSKRTDSSGAATFCTKGSGTCAGSYVKVFADGVQLCSFPSITGCQHSTPARAWGWGILRTIYR